MLRRRLVAYLMAPLLVAYVAPVAGADDLNPPKEPECSHGSDPEDNGFGGVKVGCEFVCNASNLLSVEVVSSDEDAYVHGLAKCGGAKAECNGQHTCCENSEKCADKNTDFTDHASSGTCAAKSEEFWDSYLWVECTAFPEKPPYCPIHVICDRAHSQTGFAVVGGEAFGWTCVNTGECFPVEVACDMTVERILCWVGEPPQL